VIDKIDRKDQRIKEVVADTENLFLSLADDADLLDFPIVYCIGKDGKAFLKVPETMEEKADITPLWIKFWKRYPMQSKMQMNPSKCWCLL